MEFRPTRMLTQGRVRVVEPIRRRLLDKTQGRVAANTASSQTHGSTASTLAPSTSGPQQVGGNRPLSTQTMVRTLRGMFKGARRAAADQARLRRADQYAMLKQAYSVLHRWKREQVSEGADRELRRETEIAIAPNSSLQLVLIRSALPKLDLKAAAKWAAALEVAVHEEIAPKHFIGFLREIGGIEGAHRRRARLRRKNGRP